MALNRKNALFAGHDEGAENWACVASLIETCKLNDVEPQAYIADVLDKLVNLWPASHRRTHAMGTAQSSRRPSARSLTRSLKVNLPTPWDVKTAYYQKMARDFEIVIARCGRGGRGIPPGHYFATSNTSQLEMRARTLQALQSKDIPDTERSRFSPMVRKS